MYYTSKLRQCYTCHYFPDKQAFYKISSSLLFFAHDFGVVIVSNFFVSIFSTRLFAEAKSWLYSAATIAAAAMASATRRHHHGRGLRGCGGRWQPQVVSLLWWWQAQTLSLSERYWLFGHSRDCSIMYQGFSKEAYKIDKSKEDLGLGF